MKRPGNNPKRRICAPDRLSHDERTELAQRAKYVGSGHHKRYPANYNLERTSPRPTKSLCDLVEIILLDDAQTLLKTGILNGMFSEFWYGEFPKFVWSVNDKGEVYEAKTNSNTPGEYHGYRLEEADNMRGYVEAVWKQRCPPPGP